MLGNLLDYFAAIDDDDLAVHGLETMALCAAANMAAHRTARDARRGDIHSLLGRWLALASHDRPPDEYARFQPMLGELLQLLEANPLAVLKSDEAALLFSAAAILKVLPETPCYESFRTRLEPLQEHLGATVAAHPPVPGLPALHERWFILCPHDIALSPIREVKKLAGIPIDFKGRVLTIPSRGKFVGSLLDDAMLVVEEGPCCIEGYVQGTVATRGDCIVQENIRGMVVSREGDIHARKIIDRARVIAKWGSVHCAEAASPTLVFAGRRITIDGDATRGAYAAYDITLRGRALGCTITVAGTAEAARFVQTDRFSTAVVLRHGLEAADYGEELDLATRRMLARAARLKQRVRSAEEFSRTLATEVEQDAHTVLLFLSGGDDVRERIESLERSQRRLAALNRVILSLHQLSSEVEESTYAAPWERSDEAAHDSVDDSLAAIIDELRELEPNAGEGVFALEREVNQIQQFRTQMQQLRSNRLFVVSLVAEWRQRLRHWLSERDVLVVSIQQARREMDTIMRVLGNAGTEAATSVKRLREVLADEALLARDRNLAMRANAPFVRLMRRAVNNKLQRLRDLKLEAQTLRTHLSALQEELHAKVRLRILEHEHGAARVTVTGRFDAGVRLCTDALVLEAEDPPETVLLTLRQPREDITSFARVDTGIIEVE